MELRATRREAMLGAAGLLALGSAPAMATRRMDATEVLSAWYSLALKLVRHTPTYSPPVASRAFAYLGVAAHEAVAGLRPDLVSLSHQLTGLTPPPRHAAGEIYDEAAVLHGALGAMMRDSFGNTGPTGQRVLAKLEATIGRVLTSVAAPDTLARSLGHGRTIADHIIAWSREDGGARIDNLGFPESYTPSDLPEAWRPTSHIGLQQAPLLPRWGENRAFALADKALCGIALPPEYSEAPGSAFHTEALEVYTLRATLTDEQRLIARFWSDDPMLSPTPPGHWIAIALQVFARENTALERRTATLARLGVAVADAFIACWRCKYQYNLLRPVTYIHRVIDPRWEALLITPPFPEYPSGHSVQSAAAATVLEAEFGADYGFEDRTHERDGLAPRRFASFAAAAEESAISRLYGGIHFRAACAQGLALGRCTGGHAARLTTSA